MSTTLERYGEQRDALLMEIIDRLSRDERFVAAWLTGSFAGGGQDSISDIDLSLVVSDPYAGELCRRLDGPMSQTSPERLSLFSQFGRPALIHENNNNAPEGGTFTFIMYAGSAIMIDWTLVPRTKAIRPYASKLLFDEAGIAVAPPPQADDEERSKKSVAETWAFFWMMSAITVKYILRGDGVFAAEWIENLHRMLQEVERQLDGKPWTYTRGSLSRLSLDRQMQIQSMQGLCRRMMSLKPRVAAWIRTEPATPDSEVEILMYLAEE